MAPEYLRESASNPVIHMLGDAFLSSVPGYSMNSKINHGLFEPIDDHPRRDQ